MDGITEDLGAGAQRLAPAASAPPIGPLPPLAPAPAELLGPLFTGSGKEYFRIWIVNLMLIVATLGLYSAWAKVRRLQYFDRNTRLAGAVFDFRGNPLAILRGRLLALVLLACYHYAFGFSRSVALAIVGALLLALPYLLRGALRFRLQNSYYRGLPFGFSGSVAGAYLVFLPLILLFLGPGLLLALDPSGKSLALIALLYLAFPYLYGRLKAYQHGNMRYGGVPASYTASPWRFYRYYLVALGLSLLASAVIGGISFMLNLLLEDFLQSQPLLRPVAMVAGLALGYGGFLLMIPYMVVRSANLVWSHTSFPGLRFESAMSARAFARLQVANVVLTLLTLGLYRPFAVVRVHRFRLAGLSVVAEHGFEAAVAQAVSTPALAGKDGASGDGAADFFDFDLSL